MVQEEQLDLIGEFREAFNYVGGKLIWASGRRNCGKKAGYNSKEGYIQVRVKLSNGDTKSFLAHRIIFAIHKGYLPYLIDHIDRSPSNNLIENLRDVSKRINAINSGLPSNNSSGFKGVSFHKQSGKWSTQIKCKGVKYHLGLFLNKEDAIEARIKGEEVYNDF